MGKNSLRFSRLFQFSITEFAFSSWNFLIFSVFDESKLNSHKWTCLRTNDSQFESITILFKCFGNFSINVDRYYNYFTKTILIKSNYDLIFYYVLLPGSWMLDSGCKSEFYFSLNSILFRFQLDFLYKTQFQTE